MLQLFCCAPLSLRLLQVTTDTIRAIAAGITHPLVSDFLMALQAITLRTITIIRLITDMGMDMDIIRMVTTDRTMVIVTTVMAIETMVMVIETMATETMVTGIETDITEVATTGRFRNNILDTEDTAETRQR